MIILVLTSRGIVHGWTWHKLRVIAALLYYRCCYYLFRYVESLFSIPWICYITTRLAFQQHFFCLKRFTNTESAQLIQGVLTDTITLRNMEITRCILCTKNYYHGGNGIHPNGGFTKKKTRRKERWLKTDKYLSGMKRSLIFENSELLPRWTKSIANYSIVIIRVLISTYFQTLFDVKLSAHLSTPLWSSDIFNLQVQSYS